MTPNEAGGLLAYGTPGLIVVIVLGLLVPIVAALVWQLRVMGKGFTDEVRESRVEREQMSQNYREERHEDAGRLERVTGALVTRSEQQTAAMHQLCRALEQRPCIVKAGGLLSNPGEEAADDSGGESGP